MKILLVKPSNLSDHIQPSLGLGYLATQLREDHEVAILDAIKDGIPNPDLAGVIAVRRPDVVGIQCYTYDVPLVHPLLRELKRRLPDVTTVLGGAHVSVMGRSLLETFGEELDYALQGEAERSFPLLLAALKDGPPRPDELAVVPGLVWRAEDGPRANDTCFTEDLDSLGYPSWDLIRPEEYPEAQHGAFFRQFPIAPIMTTRGCPHQCTFCSAPILSGRRLRHHSVPYIVEQVRYLYHRRGIREIHIVDDNFTMDREFAKSVLRALIATGLPITLATPNGVRLDTLDDELLDLMKRAGVYLVTVAVESGSDRVLGLMKKHLTVDRVREACALIRRHGFDMAGFFIIGFPGETRADIEATLRLSRELGMMRANFFTYLPLPATESFRGLMEAGEMEKIDWDHFYFYDAPYVPRGMTRRELLWLKRKAFLLFHLRPWVIWKNLKEIRGSRHFRFLLKRAYRWLVKS